MTDNEQLNVPPADNSTPDISGKSSAKPRGAANVQSAPASAGKPKKEKKSTPNKKPCDNKAFMYLGPNIPGGILFNGGVYKELPEHLKDTFEKVPEIKELFIEIKEAPAFKAELERQGSEAYRLHQNVERLISEGVLRNGGV